MFTHLICAIVLRGGNYTRARMETLRLRQLQFIACDHGADMAPRSLYHIWCLTLTDPQPVTLTKALGGKFSLPSPTQAASLSHQGLSSAKLID